MLLNGTKNSKYLLTMFLKDTILILVMFLIGTISPIICNKRKEDMVRIKNFFIYFCVMPTLFYHFHWSL